MIEPHAHDGSDAPQIDPQNLLGFPVTSIAPTDSTTEGTIRLYSSGGVYKLYIRINKGWRSVTLT